jgi:glycosyltransferase involved in cell wall biosynthesis
VKIAVYAIALNEAKHVQRWLESAKDADSTFIADTGSTDETVSIAESLGINVSRISISPWRFDDARNQALEMVPSDFDLCISLDLDEVLPPDWRKVIEEAWNSGNEWPIYEHVMERDEFGNVRGSFLSYFRVHPRENFRWKYPIHEIVEPTAGQSFDRKKIQLQIEHFPDKTKSRSSYLPLLEQAAIEFPADWRMKHYLNREYFYEKNWPMVIASAKESLKIDGGWDAERASTCLWASEASLELGDEDAARDWAKRATVESPMFYEAWHWRAHLAYLEKNWIDCLDFSSKLLVLERQEHHLVKPGVWEWWGYDLIALSSYYLGNRRRALEFGRLALAGHPMDSRLSKNMEFYEAGV